MRLPHHLQSFSEANPLEALLPDDDFIQEVETNRDTPILGLQVGLRIIDKILHGFLKARYILLGAHPNVGKTKTLDFCVISACIYAMEHNLKVTFFYVSLEISLKKKKADWCAVYLNLKYGKNYSSDFIMGYIPDNKPSEHDMELIREAYTFVRKILVEYIRLSATSSTPKALVEGLLLHYLPYGTVLRAAAKPSETVGEFVGFTLAPGKKLPLAFLCIDHLALLDGPTTKTAMDEMSTYMVKLRNHLEMSGLFVQQLNQEIMKSRREALTRHGKGKAHDSIFPRQLDFGDSTYTYRDADVVIGLTRPCDFELDEFDTIPCTIPQQGGLGTCLVVAVVMKNRNGPVGGYFPLFLNGAAGVLHDLPILLDADITSYVQLAQKLYG